MKAEHIASAVKDYGRTLAMPPKEAYAGIDVIEIKEAIPPRYSVRFHLYTSEEGESDLSIELTLIDEIYGDPMRIEIDNIIVF